MVINEGGGQKNDIKVFTCSIRIATEFSSSSKRQGFPFFVFPQRRKDLISRHSEFYRFDCILLDWIVVLLDDCLYLIKFELTWVNQYRAENFRIGSLNLNIHFGHFWFLLNPLFSPFFLDIDPSGFRPIRVLSLYGPRNFKFPGL